MVEKRQYDDPCGIARALDLVGERWAMLIVRELLLGPKRFTDLRHGLPGASQNVLSHRLRDLEETGIVRRRKLGPPASVWVYELTRQGRDLEPVLHELGRWGSRTPLTSPADLSIDALVVGLKTMFDPAATARARYVLRLAGDSFRIDVGDGRFAVVRGTADDPDAVIETDIATLTATVFGGRDIDEALRSGDLVAEGPRRVVLRFFKLFRQPEFYS